MQQKYDIVIVGSGLTGNCLALMLNNTGLRIAIVEAATREQLYASPAGDRALALSAGTVQTLDALGLWHGINKAATAIKQIHISDQGHFGKTRLSAQKEHVDALGYVISARDIETHIANLVSESTVELITPARVVGLMSSDNEIFINLKQGTESLNITAKLLVGADGGLSSVRQLMGITQEVTEYGQTAIVTTIKSTLANNYTAFERFTVSGPLALLPISSHECSVVWTRKDEDANALMLGSEIDFITELQHCFGYKLGQLSLTAPRRTFPLSLIRAEKMVVGRAVIIGNAAHQLHPVAGQGFNLGFRDVVQLAEQLIKQHELNSDIGDADFLKNYAKTRKQDQDLTIGFTDIVVNVFSNEWLALITARNIGLTLLDYLPSVKTLLTRHAMGIAV
jgi:2-octaprenyl-6-methoxyphenol hydroxylase